MTISTLEDVKSTASSTGFVFDGFVSLLFGFRLQAPKAYTLIQLSPQNTVNLNTLQDKGEYLSYLAGLNPMNTTIASEWGQGRKDHAINEMARLRQAIESHVNQLDSIKVEVLGKLEARIDQAVEPEKQKLIDLKDKVISDLNEIKTLFLSTYEECSTLVLSSVEDAKNAIRF